MYGIGGSSGIGAATAELFAKEGASVAIVGRNEERLNNVYKRCEELGAETLIIKADISKDDDAATIVKQTIDKYGKLDILVNNAAVLKMTGIFDDNILETFDEVIKNNLRSIIHITKLAVPYLIITKGNIVNVSSVSSTARPSQTLGLTFYAISKAGMDLYTRAAALELAASGVRVNAINPGPVITDGLHSFVQEKLDDFISQLTSLGRASQADEIGDLILYLASDRARSITGSNFVVDNGLLLK